MTAEPSEITWWEDDPGRAEAERTAMATAAPDLKWLPKRGGWKGEAPLWPFAGPQPVGLLDLVGNRKLTVEVICEPVHPMVQPTVTPHGVELPPEALGRTEWHLEPSGALCLFRGTSWWDPARLVASLIPKISGWYVEYHLMMLGCLEEMPDRGVDLVDTYDDLIRRCAELRR